MQEVGKINPGRRRKIQVLLIKMLPSVIFWKLPIQIQPLSAFPKEFWLFQEVSTPISPLWHLLRDLWNFAIPGKKTPQGWCLQIPKRGRANSAQRGKNSQLHPQNSPHPGWIYFLFLLPIRNKISNFIRIAISREKFETWARICFGFSRLNSKLCRRNPKLFQGLESKAYKLFKIQGNPPDHQHRKKD